MGVNTQEIGPSDWSIIVPPQEVPVTDVVHAVDELGVRVSFLQGTLLFLPPPDDLPEGVEDAGEAWPHGTSCLRRHGRPCPTMPCQECGNGLDYVDADSFHFGVTRDASAGPQFGARGPLWTPDG